MRSAQTGSGSGSAGTAANKKKRTPASAIPSYQYFTASGYLDDSVCTAGISFGCTAVKCTSPAYVGVKCTCPVDVALVQIILVL
jgi:hypothetical protein